MSSGNFALRVDLDERLNALPRQAVNVVHLLSDLLVASNSLSFNAGYGQLNFRCRNTLCYCKKRFSPEAKPPIELRQLASNSLLLSISLEVLGYEGICSKENEAAVDAWCSGKVDCEPSIRKEQRLPSHPICPGRGCYINQFTRRFAPHCMMKADAVDARPPHQRPTQNHITTIFPCVNGSIPIAITYGAALVSTPNVHGRTIGSDRLSDAIYHFVVQRGRSLKAPNRHGSTSKLESQKSTSRSLLQSGIVHVRPSPMSVLDVKVEQTSISTQAAGGQDNG